VSRGTVFITVRGKFVTLTEKEYFKCWHSANIIQQPLCVICNASAGRHNL